MNEQIFPKPAVSEIEVIARKYGLNKENHYHKILLECGDIFNINELLEKLSRSEKEPIRKTARFLLANKISGISNYGIIVFKKPGLSQEDDKRFYEWGHRPAQYHQFTGIITEHIGSERIEFHEMIHAFTVELLMAERRKEYSGSELSDFEEEFASKIEELFAIAAKTAREKNQEHYGLQDTQEFVAEAFSCESFQKFLSKIPSKDFSVFNRLSADEKEIIASFYGSENRNSNERLNSVLTEVLKATLQYINKASDTYSIGKVDLNIKPQTKTFIERINNLMEQ